MTDEIKETPKPQVKPSPRELILENALKNAIVVVEGQNTLLLRMGMKSLGSLEWIKETKELLK